MKKLLILLVFVGGCGQQGVQLLPDCGSGVVALGPSLETTGYVVALDEPILLAPGSFLGEGHYATISPTCFFQVRLIDGLPTLSRE